MCKSCSKRLCLCFRTESPAFENPLGAGQTGTVGQSLPGDAPSASPLNPVYISLCYLNHREHFFPPVSFYGLTPEMGTHR